MLGRKLTFKARICSKSVKMHTPTVPAAFVGLRMRRPVPSPKIDEAPATKIIAISIGENVPEITCAQPRRNSQIRLIRKSQQKKQGAAVHLLHRKSRHPNMTVGQTGIVCTRWRSTPCETTPTTYSAAIRRSAQIARACEAFNCFTVRPHGNTTAGLQKFQKYGPALP